MLTKLLEEARDTLPESYRPFPLASDRNFWEKASKEMKKSFIDAAEEHLGSDFQVLKATEFMEFHRTGNRTGYQKVYSVRRQALNVAIMAELFENKGRFIDLLIDLVWMFCEQTTWIIPAHNNVGGYKHNRLPLQDADQPIVALMSADVAASLALAYYFFKDSFDEVTPQISIRLREELYRRILKPYRNHTDYWWMGFMHVSDEKLNNWNPWINSNVLMVLLTMEENRNERYFLLHKITESLDRYIESYPLDGGCDEGPGYWARAGASAFECLDLLHDFSLGSIDIYDDEKIRNMCRFIYRVHIDGPYFVNFADAGPKAVTAPSLIYRFGKAIKDEVSMSFGAYLYKNGNNPDALGRFGIIRAIHEMDVHDELMSYEGEYVSENLSFLPETELVCTRVHGEKGTVFAAAKGGSNFENHNHNDIGNFIVYGNGLPFIIDAGAMEYTKKTFSPQRYEIWTNCSHWHNVPETNGVRQVNGSEYRAANTGLIESEGKSVFSTEIQGAYPVTSGMKKWIRSISADADTAEIVVTDEFEMENETDDIMLTLMTLPQPKINGNRICLENQGTKMEIWFSEEFDAEFETILMDDEKLLKEWGEKIYRTTLNIKKAASAGCCSMMFKLI